MRVTPSLPDPLAGKLLVQVPDRERSATVARLLERELARRERELEEACQAANADSVLAEEVAEWQSFGDAVPEGAAAGMRRRGR